MKLSAKAQKSLDKVIAQFQSGDLSPITRAIRIQLDPDAPAAKWSLSNRVLAFVQTGELDCRGYKQWKQAGRQVKKGSFAGYILTPRMVKKENEDGEKESRLIGFVSVPVFASTDTDGDEPLPDYTPAELPPLTEVAERLGVSVEYLPISPDRLGDFNRIKQHIRLGTEDQAVFFHELAHSAHHQTDEDYAKASTEEKETIAEFTAAVLSNLYGVDHSGNAWDYISGYAKDPLQAIMKALRKIEDVLGIILNPEVATA